MAQGKAQGFFGLQANFDGTVTPLDEPVVAAAKAQHLYEKFGGYAAGIYPHSYGLGYAGYAPYSYVDSHVYASPISVAAPVSYTPYVNPAPAPVISPTFATHQAAITVNQLEREKLFALQAAKPALFHQITTAPAPAPIATFEATPAIPTSVQANPGSTHFTADFRIQVPSNPSSNTAFDAVLEANQLARAELLAIQAGGLYAEVYGKDPYAGLVRHASGAVTPPETAANIEARRRMFEAHYA